MNSRAEVWLWGNRIAYIYLDDGGLVRFEYVPEFLKSGIEIAPIKMPLDRRVYYFPELRDSGFSGAPGLLSESLPDKFGNAVIDDWCSRNGRDPESFDIIERLCYIGNRGMGALEYKPVLSEDYNEDVKIEALVDLASEILANRENVKVDIKEKDAMKQLYQVGSSAGGARAKAVIAWNEDTGIIKSGQIDAGPGFDYYLLKFDGVDENGDYGLTDPKGSTNVEYAYYLMAKDAGIEMMPCSLYKEGGRSHFLTKRFDRVNGEKIHVQSFGSMSHIDFRMYQPAGYERLFQTCIRLKIPQNQIEMLYRRMVFNVVAINNDDHVKNFSFLMNKKGEWSLSPAYDITYSYKPNGKWTSEHQMTVNGKGKNIAVEDMLKVAEVSRMSKRKALKIIDEVIETVYRWNEYAKEAEVPEDIRSLIKENLDSNISFLKKES